MLDSPLLDGKNPKDKKGNRIRQLIIQTNTETALKEQQDVIPQLSDGWETLFVAPTGSPFLEGISVGNMDTPNAPWLPRNH